MARRLLGTATTDANGVAVLSDGYTGTGAGEVDMIAECTIDGSTVVSQTYTVDDCSYLDTFSSDTKSKYYYENGTVNISDGALTFTGTSTNGYLNLNSANTPAISNYQGRTVYFKAEVDSLPSGATVNMRIYQTVNGSTTSTYTEYSTGGTLEHHADIDANATNVIFRIQFYNINDESVVFDNYRIV